MGEAARLSQVARLLTVSADTARHIAHLDAKNAAEIHWMAHQIEEIAESMARIGLRSLTSDFSTLPTFDQTALRHARD